MTTPIKDIVAFPAGTYDTEWTVGGGVEWPDQLTIFLSNVTEMTVQVGM